MKIAIFTDSFLPGLGGTEKAVKRLATELAKEHQVMIFAPDYHRPWDEEKDAPFKVVRAKSIGVSNVDFWAMPGITKKLKKALDDFKPDVLHCHTMGMMGGFANGYAKKHNVPVIYTIHTNFEVLYAESLKSKFLAKLLIKHVIKRLKKADEIYAVSDFLGGVFKRYGVKKDIYCIKNGNDKCETLPEKPKKDGKELLLVGRIAEYKNIYFAVDAIKELSKLRDDFVLRIAGSGPAEKKFKKYVKNSGVSDKIVMLDQIKSEDELKKIYLNADLMLFCSTIDADGLVVLESANAGTPSLVIEGTATAERMIDGVTGYVCKKDATLYAKRIDKILSDEEGRLAVGLRAREMFNDWGYCANEYLSVYQKNIEKKGQKL